MYDFSYKKRTYLKVVFFAVICCATLSFIEVANVSALIQHPLTENTEEKAAKALCGTGADQIKGTADDDNPATRRGAIWLSSSKNSYYNDSVVINNGDTSVNVYIRGSVYSCDQTETIATSATDVQRDVTSYPQSSHLNLLSPSSFSRGTVSGANHWSSQGSEIATTLSVSGLATGNRDKDVTVVITIGLYRCFHDDTNNETGACYTQPVKVTIIRKMVNWVLSSTSDVKNIVGSDGKVVKNASGNDEKSISKPGDTVTWQHTVTNNGPDVTDLPISYYYRNISGFGPDNLKNINVGKYSTSLAKSKSISYTSNYKITQDNVSDTNYICRATVPQPKSAHDAGWSQSDPDRLGSPPGNHCVLAPYNYKLTPSISMNVADIIETGSPIIVNPLVSNVGPTKSRSTNWELTKIIVSANSSIPVVNANSPLKPCLYFRTSCSASTPKGSTVFDFASGIALPSYNTNVDDLAAGSKICFALSIKSPTNSNVNNWYHSVPECLIIGKKPKVQILGGDLWSRASVQTGQSIKNINGAISIYGSWGEYGIFARSSITGMASSSAFASPLPVSPNACAYSNLSFTNTPFGGTNCTGVGIGNYQNLPASIDIAASFPGSGTAISGTVNLSTENSGIYNANNLVLSGPSTLQKNKTIIIKATGTVTIAGDQLYSNGPYSSISELPQLVIIADKIVINSGVTNVDAWLVANSGNGIIETCNTGSSTYSLPDLPIDLRLNINKCNQPLNVNGPVIAKQLWLRRTFGSGTVASGTSGVPAETFNLRADTYLWASARAAITGGRAQTVYTTELPPRF